jgi:phage tail tape measure protein, TP901 family
MDIFDLYAKIDVDLATFESGIRTAEDKFKIFTGNLDKLSSKIGDSIGVEIGDGAKKAAEKVEAAVDDINDSKIEDIGDKAFDELKTDAQETTGRVESAVTKINGFKIKSIGNGAFDSFKSQIKAAEEKLKSLGKAAKATFDKIEAACSKINGIGNTAFKAFGAGAAVLGTGLGAGLKYVIENGSAFEAQMSKVEAISGATSEQMQALSEKAAQLGRDTKFSSTEAGQAYEYMAMAGWNTEQMLSGVAGIMDLAAASGEDLASVSDIVTDALTAFGLKAEDSTHFADVLAAASTSANTNVAMMGETFKYAAPLAGALGFSVEDVAGAIGLMANSGIKGTQAGTTLRSIFTRLASPVKDSAAAMQKLGVKITDNSGKTRKLNDIIADLRKGFAKLNETEQAEYASMIAGQEAMSGFLALMNAAPEDIEKVSSAIENADGKAKQMAQTMLNNLPGAVTLFKSSLQSLAVDHIYSDAKDKLKEFVMNAKGLIDELSEAYEEAGWGGIGNKLFDFADYGIKAAGKDLPGMLESGGNTLASIFSKAEGLLSGNSEEINGIISSGGEALRNGFGGFVELGKTAAKEFGGGLVKQLILLKGDIFGAGLDLLGSLCEGIGNDSDEIAEGASKAMQNIGGKLEENLPKASTAFSKLLDSFAAETDKEENKESLKRAADNVINFIFGEDGLTSAENVENIVSVAGNVLGALGTGLINKVADGTLSDGLTSVIDGIYNGLEDLIEDTNWGELGGKIIKGIFNIGGDITNLPQYLKAKAFGKITGQEISNLKSPSQIFREINKSTDKATVQYPESAIGREVSSIVNSILAKSQTEKAPPTEVNLNIDGERVAQVIVDPVIKNIRQRDKEVYLH